MLSNYVISALRTIIPSLWGTALAWLVSVGVLDQAAAAGPGASAGGFLVTAGIGVWYLAVRLLEEQSWFPTWLSVLLLGGSRPPSYRLPLAAAIERS